MTIRFTLTLCLALALACVATVAIAFVPFDEPALCAQSGGQWNECGSGCGPFTCENLPVPDQACLAVCVPQCDCPADHVFDFGVGCLPIDECKNGGGAPIPPPPQDMDGDKQSVAQGDCDDNDPEVYDGAEELCDGKDNDCDAEIDEGCEVEPIDADGDTYPADVDCNDNNAASYPGADELCDLEDNDCDGDIDEGCNEDPPEPSELQLVCEDTGGTYSCPEADTPCNDEPCPCDETCTCLDETTWDEDGVEGCVEDEDTECPEGSEWDGDACVELPTDEDDLCESTGGTIPGCMPCGVAVTCGVEPASEEECMVAGCLPGGCVCPSGMLLDTDAGCVPEADCPGQDEPPDPSEDPENDAGSTANSDTSSDTSSGTSSGTSSSNSSGCQTGGNASPWGLLLLLALSGLGLVIRVGRAGGL